MKFYMMACSKMSKAQALILLIFAIVSFFIAPSCTDNKQQQRFIIGFSQCVESDAWRKTMLQEMRRELAFHPNITFHYREANANSEKQIEQVKELLKKNIDLLIISPNEAAPLTPVVEETFNSGIPVIVVDRKIASSLYTAYVGADNYEIGMLAGQYAVNLLGGKGNTIEVTGLPKSSAAIERHKGFTDALKRISGMKVVQSLNGEWIKPQAKQQLSKVAGLYPNVDLIFAHNDMMALGAYEVYRDRQATHKPKIIGVDGLPGDGRGMQFISDKKITATMLYPTGGKEAIQTAIKILNKEEVKKENLLQTSVIDSSNVRLMQLQAAKAAGQHQDIERQQAMLAEQKKIYRNQRTFLYILASSLAVSLALGGIAFLSLRDNRKINRKLQLQNTEILEQKNQLSQQKDQLIEMAAQAKAANEAKVNFFTNISHEFRSPLMLILGPLEELMSDSRTSHSALQSLSVVQKNAVRLLRLVNQLMGLRKIEVDKMKVRPSENDLIAFIHEIVQAYKTIAYKRGVDLRLITKEKHLKMWFDVNMLDKVIFNLLSNAFKFTGDGGYIHVYVYKSEDGNKAVIKVEDNGVGMTKDAVNHAFELFYQGEYENYKGSGLGLALSKELIQLHKGSISVTSEKWKGTTFEIRLPLGCTHLEKVETAESRLMPPEVLSDFQENVKVYTTDLWSEQSTEPESATNAQEHSILIIEDDQDLRHFLKRKLQSQYEIIEANTSQTALQQAFDTVPDLIICDVVIPGKDGMELTRILKNDIRTSHIPVILMSIKTEVEKQIEAMQNRADAYMTKPFNVRFLEETIKSLLANRAVLKDRFVGDPAHNLKTQSVSKLERKFINEFTAIVENNLSDVNFNVDDICKHMGVSRIQLYRKVKALLNVNVYDYILNTRMQKAKYLLHNEDFSISEIAYKVGFASPNYFSTVFKSKFGMTPRAYKEK